MGDEQVVTGQFEPEDEYTITSLETLRVMTEPLRIRILGELLAESRTVKQLAQALELKPTKLYYHMNLMEVHGLIKVVSTRVVSGIIEKQYRVRAYSYPMDESLMMQAGSSDDAGLPSIITNVLEYTADEIKRVIKSGILNLQESNHERRVFSLLHNLSRLSPEKVHEFVTRFESLIAEFGNCDDEKGEGDYRVYGLTLALYPTQHKTLPTRQKKERKGDA